jgi:hypothetical protein
MKVLDHVGHCIGKGEVESSILSCSTIIFNKLVKLFGEEFAATARSRRLSSMPIAPAEKR